MKWTDRLNAANSWVQIARRLAAMKVPTSTVEALMALRSLEHMARPDAILPVLTRVSQVLLQMQRDGKLRDDDTAELARAIGAWVIARQRDPATQRAVAEHVETWLRPGVVWLGEQLLAAHGVRPASPAEPHAGARPPGRR
jgi:hypothetical protein